MPEVDTLDEHLVDDLCQPTMELADNDAVVRVFWVDDKFDRIEIKPKWNAYRTLDDIAAILPPLFNARWVAKQQRHSRNVATATVEMPDIPPEVAHQLNDTITDCSRAISSIIDNMASREPRDMRHSTATPPNAQSVSVSTIGSRVEKVTINDRWGNAASAQALAERLTEAFHLALDADNGAAIDEETAQLHALEKTIDDAWREVAEVY